MAAMEKMMKKSQRTSGNKKTWEDYSVEKHAKVLKVSYRQNNRDKWDFTAKVNGCDIPENYYEASYTE